ncbi:hypothetical protein K1T71_000359 [Dendrolimus kikuchii]|uniref:Uncharacterized protein n=1 Tax=Dendrolimus kikuchii TaxID=765133 RepID=A0ACC1DJC4_9NEOP|nr:hypothetical protein K1T71_000359 [Dendrolimus kikuchii]
MAIRPIRHYQLMFKDTLSFTMSIILSSSAKIDRWFSLLPSNAPALSRPESGFVSGVEDGTDATTLAEARNLLLQLGAKKKRRLLPLRFTRRKKRGTKAEQ